VGNALSGKGCACIKSGTIINKIAKKCRQYWDKVESKNIFKLSQRYTLLIREKIRPSVQALVMHQLISVKFPVRRLNDGTKYL